MTQGGGVAGEDATGSNGADDRPRLRDQLWFRQTRNAIALAVVLGLSLSLATIALDLRDERESALAELEQAVTTLSRPAAQAVFNVDPGLARTVAEGLLSLHAVRAVRIIDDLGDSLASLDVPPTRAALHQQWIASLVFPGQERLSFPIVQPDKGRVLGQVEVGLDRVLAAEQFVQRAGVVLLGGILRNLILSACLIGLFYFSLTRPLLRIVAAVRAVDPDNPTARLPLSERHRTSELGRMVLGLNSLLGRLAHTQSALRDSREELERRVAERTAELEAANERLRDMAATDALTGLANRRAFMEAAEQELARAARAGRRTSLLMMDVDHFKQINDSLGHAAGDAVLVRLAGALRSLLRAGDLPARHGGEEFVIILPETGTEAAENLAQRLCDGIRDLKVPELECGAPPLTVSLGVATGGPGALGLDGLLSLADAALYHAKRNGRDRVSVAGANA